MLGFCYVLVTSTAQGQGYVLYILKRGGRWNMDVLKWQGQLRRAQRTPVDGGSQILPGAIWFRQPTRST